MLEVRHDDNKKNGVLYLLDNGIEIGFAKYRWADDAKIIVGHTEVYEQFGGKGYGKQLVKIAVDFARQKNAKIIPFCPFVNAVLNRTPEFHDVLSKE